jgi:hypothetical protein
VIKRIKKFKFLFLIAIPICMGLAFIAYMHILAWQTGLKGFRGGPQDAFRHTLASAYVSRYIGPWAVDAFTLVSERNLDSSYDQMDWHNNGLGKRLGQSSAENLFISVSEAVKNGKEDSQDPQVIRWLPEKKWANFLGM